MLVSAKEMLNKARDGKYAVGQFNINNLEWTKAVLLTAQENNSPVILGVSEGAGKYMCGYKTIVGMVKGMIEELKITVPVALHLSLIHICPLYMGSIITSHPWIRESGSISSTTSGARISPCGMRETRGSGLPLNSESHNLNRRDLRRPFGYT